MQIIRNYRFCPASAYGSTLVIGKFDAVHKGHQHVIDTALKHASKCKQKLALMTFEPHPATLFKPELQHINILPLSEKIKHLAALGIYFLFIQRFSMEFAKLSAIDFVKIILVDHLKIKHLVVGEDFAFGANREGDAETMHRLAQEFGFKFTSITMQQSDQQNYSSSQIRNYLSTGDITQASVLLGYNYYISGRVIRGAKRGTKIGFPTANIALKNIFRPLLGVYLVKIYIESDSHKFTHWVYYGIANLGSRPTFDETTHCLEVHVFDFNQNIYGKKLKVELLNYIRPQQRFSGIEELTTQIKQDIKLAKQYLSSL